MKIKILLFIYLKDGGRLKSVYITFSLKQCIHTSLFIAWFSWKWLNTIIVFGSGREFKQVDLKWFERKV